jgi:MoxR-like ATPase
MLLKAEFPAARAASEPIARVISAASTVILGKESQVRLALACLLARGHLLIEDLPGVGKTTLAHVLARSLGMHFQRIQFTSDMLPADIIGVSIYERDTGGFKFHPGPVFAQVILADEVNRATPKTQSALLEAMQDVSVSVGKTTYPLEQPFLVMATQNPIEMEGTYPLPEAQLDRFFFKLKVTYPGEAAMHEILERTTSVSDRSVERVVDGPEILEMRQVARAVPIARPVQAYAIRLTLGSHPGSPYGTPLVTRYVRYGASPRAAQALVLAGKIHALNRGQAFVSIDDIRSAALPALRHRILLNFEGEADEVNTDTIVNELIATVATE